MTKSYLGRVEELKKFIDQLPKQAEPEVGTEVWVPCAGIKSRGILNGHVGQIVTAKLNDQNKIYWDYSGAWLPKNEAVEQHAGITISSSSGHCPMCVEITNFN